MRTLSSARSPGRAPALRTRSRALVFVALAGCAGGTAVDPGLEGLAVGKVAPSTVIPGTKLVIKGESFVDDEWGAPTLHLKGTANGSSVDVKWPAKFVDFNTLNVAIDGAMLDQVGGDVDFHGSAIIEILATSDHQTYASKDLTIDLSFRNKLTPSPTSIEASGVHFINDQIEVNGDGFLLGGDEGVTVAKLTGCFTLDTGGGCNPITAIELPLLPVEELSRQKASFAFSPKVAGIKPGAFTGAVTIINKQVAQTSISADPITVGYDLVTSQIFSVDPPAASLGQYVFVHGGGFVGGEAGAVTELELTGMFTKTGGPTAPVQLTLIPEFVEGRLVRYIVNTDDALGMALDLRQDTGSFTGTITPIVNYGSDRVRGVAKQAAFQLAPIKQIIFLHFQPSYVEGLRDFGLRAVDKKIRDRIVGVCQEAYKGVNIEFRLDAPVDFALFENVELVGVDPNNQGLFGYDNSPGKDNGNIRLYDEIGGVNALTQQDGYPGYGGVFIRSLMGFSKHPTSGKPIEGADPVFDQIFDPFRGDRDGKPVTSEDLGGDLPAVDGAACPGHDRRTQLQCAIFVMGNLVGGTLAHEIGHSLGLANPYDEGFHDAGDAPNRLMDAGGDRPFLERAVLQGQGPGVFCDDEYTYLRMILPTSAPANNVERPGCF